MGSFTRYVKPEGGGSGGEGVCGGGGRIANFGNLGEGKGGFRNAVT